MDVSLAVLPTATILSLKIVLTKELSDFFLFRSVLMIESLLVTIKFVIYYLFACHGLSYSQKESIPQPTAVSEGKFTKDSIKMTELR